MPADPTIVLSRDDPGYPRRLRDLADDAPERLFVRGRLPPEGSTVGIVGARRASPDGLRAAEALARVAAQHGICVVSGGAMGVDGAAHAGALAAKGRTVVVLATSVDAPSPRVHGRLFRAIIDAGGALISEAEGTVERSAFAHRNRLIAALADAVVVVEGRQRSGTRYTVRAARKLGRRLGAVPWAWGDPRGAMAGSVFSRGGQALVSPEALLSLVGGPRRRRRRSVGPPTPLCPRPLWRALAQPVEPESLGSAFGLDVREILRLLTRLQLQGWVREISGGRFERVTVEDR